jgi:hypothetical protein
LFIKHSNIAQYFCLFFPIFNQIIQLAPMGTLVQYLMA